MREGPRIIACILFAAVLVMLAVIWSKQHQAIYAMPLVKTASPQHGFVCVPTITPKVGPPRQRTWT